jgi:hypothetical protein
LGREKQASNYGIRKMRVYVYVYIYMINTAKEQYIKRNDCELNCNLTYARKWVEK